MNRREFGKTLGATALVPILPISAKATGTALPAYANGWAKAIVDVHGAYAPKVLSQALGLSNAAIGSLMSAKPVTLQREGMRSNGSSEVYRGRDRNWFDRGDPCPSQEAEHHSDQQLSEEIQDSARELHSSQPGQDPEPRRALHEEAGPHPV